MFAMMKVALLQVVIRSIFEKLPRIAEQSDTQETAPPPRPRKFMDNATGELHKGLVGIDHLSQYQLLSTPKI
jgi:hypothetical protein